jgi:hypothetical protein
MRWTISIAVVLVFLGMCMPVTAWTANLSVSSDNRTMDFVIGSDTGVTDNYDPGVDSPLPPPPPGSTFDVYLIGSGIFDMLQKDIRQTPAWSMYVKSKKSIDLHWDTPPVPLKMEIGSSSMLVNQSGTYTLTTGEYQILIQQVNTTVPLAISTVAEPPSYRYRTDIPPDAPVITASPTVTSALTSVMTSITSPVPVQETHSVQSQDQSGAQPQPQSGSGQTVTANPQTPVNLTVTEQHPPVSPTNTVPGFRFGVALVGVGVWMIYRRATYDDGHEGG